MNETQLHSNPPRISIASFGAALATLAIAPNVEATIVDLTLSPGSISFRGPASSGTAVDLNTGGGAYFYQFNDTIGKTIHATTGFTYGGVGNLAGIRLAAASSTITAGMAFDPGIALPYSTASGTVTIAFLTNTDRVGWIRMDLGGQGEKITYLAAAFNDTRGGCIHAGGGACAVPEPSTASLLAGMGLLALGATGVRRLRQRRRGEQGPGEQGEMSA